MDIFIHANIPEHIFKAAKYIIEKYHEREEMLFANNADNTIPRTNNGMEQFFRKLRRNLRKRNGNTSTGNILAQTGVSLALFQNMENPEYIRAVFGKESIQSVFARHRMHFKRKGLTMIKIVKLGVSPLNLDNYDDMVRLIKSFILLYLHRRTLSSYFYSISV